ncbi:MAG: hypothetical protein L3K08_04195 [Thermoplasmata archaeon]|nr:hypothetical protein [Thermoplasmata archaeon]
MVGAGFGALIGAVRTGTMNLYSADLNANPGLLNRWYRSSVTVSGRIVPAQGLPAAGWTVTIQILVSPGGTANNGPFEEVGGFEATTDSNGNWSIQQSGDFDNRDVLTFNLVGLTPPPGYGQAEWDSPAGTWYDPQAPGHPSPWPQGAGIDPVNVYAEQTQTGSGTGGGHQPPPHHGRAP